MDLASTGGNDAYLLASPLRIWVNAGALPWVESAAALNVAEADPGRAMMALDFDRDGDQDLLVVRYRGRPLLLRNDATQANAWLTVAPRGVRSNRDGWGAKVWVTNESGRTWYSEVGTVSHFTGVGPREAHVGLGAMPASAPLHVEVEFLGGNRVSLDGVLPNQLLTVVEPDVAPPRGRIPTRVLPDCDADGLPDACGYDCDADGTPDACQISRDSSLDRDESGFLDTCEGIPPVDAGSPSVDAGRAAIDAGQGPRGRGAGCSVSAPSPSGVAWSWFALVLLWRRRRLSLASTGARARTRR
jgi:MYXO-CTERM domain-containing protein